MIRHLLLCAAAWLCALGPAAAWNERDAEKDEALSLRGDRARGEEAFVVCQGCHRVGALGRADGSYPRLAGQHAAVLIKQMADVRSGRRANPKMQPFADHRTLTVQDMADIAAYLQVLPVPPNQGQGSGAALALGRRLYEQDCARCHGSRGEGDAKAFYPRVSGQHYGYLLREGMRIRDRQRRNANPDMVTALQHYADDELAAVSDYMSRLAVDGAR